MLFFRLNQVSRECPFLFVYSIRLRNTLSSTMRAMSVVDEAQTPDLLHGYALHPRTGTRKASPEIRGVIPSLDIRTERRNSLIDTIFTLFAEQ